MRDTLALSAILAAAIGLLVTFGTTGGRSADSRACHNVAPGGIVALTQCPDSFARRAPAPAPAHAPVVVARVGDIPPAH